MMRPAVIYIMGVSGSGKTTIGKKLSARIKIPFFDADDFHSPANKEKMKTGHPLTDDDRAEWLTSLNALAKKQMKAAGAIIACSALKEKYRKVLSGGITVPLFWIFLQGGYDLIRERMESRTDHFMAPAMLSSQFDALEIPEECMTFDVSKDPDEIVEAITSIMDPA
jgi:carbohydrate kinase (thermoresistant glucokinase family)